MEVVRVFNNNVVLALDDAGRDVILTGRGLGFQARPGGVVDPAQIVRVFVPTDGRDPDHLAQLLAGIPPEHIALVGSALADVGLDKLSRNPALLIALADHVSFALKRIAVGMVLEYPFLAEVQNLYAEEYREAAALLSAINGRSETQLPEAEAVGLALHLVNAGFATGDLSYTYTMTGAIQQMVAVIEQTFGLDLDPGSVSVGRFITHLRYLFVRIHQFKQLDQKHSPIGVAIRATYPDEAECALRLAALVELRLGSPLTDDEVSYLALHVARVAADQA
ncbi:PRD domain-containing protein [Pengzhenrongella frigida]|uniref:PRD domain-containing protein n=1 Tax=Pengzhenrongella frigida TaxID=1259133 RepID=A0A4Q5N3I5_9MICO|nr:PRD domain-containing protein [Cellulomonas sp. HLT2-17]RYV52788.1 PRD domain-containing protein [Cellulomonas sp. HLT2-17]